MKTQILITIDHARPLPDKVPLTDIISQRIYGFLFSQGVEAGVAASVFECKCEKCEDCKC